MTIVSCRPRTAVMASATLWMAVIAVFLAFVPLHEAAAGLPTRTIRVCPTEQMTRACDTDDVSNALAQAKDGDVVILAPGVYNRGGVIRGNNVTVRGEPGAHITAASVQGKAALVIQGDNAVIEGLECSNIAVSSGNGACIRAEGTNLTVRRARFRDSEQGILGGRGTTLIEDSIFERLGHRGQAHGLYISGDALVIRRSQFLGAKNEGHGVKSRTARTVIENSVLASLDGDDSRLIDISNGGEFVVRNSVLQEGPNSANFELIGVGLEGVKHPANSILIENNIILMERRGPMRLIGYRDVPAPVIRNNVIVGGKAADAPPGNTWYPNREAAGLPPPPQLPKPK